MHKAGLRWGSGNSYLKDTKYVKDICYHPLSKSYEIYSYFKSKKIKIYDAKLFIRESKINKLLKIQYNKL